MPQMSPFNWLIMMTCFIMILFVTTFKLFFTSRSNHNSTLNYTNYMANTNFSWLW